MDKRFYYTLLKYNKNLQNKINISLLDYKTLSGRYIKYDINGKVKEYNIYDDILLFEGEYLNGKRNGKGKKYNEFYNLIFEGEFSNGKKMEKQKNIILMES